ncbi:lipid-A-disaccharide synthase [Aristophania vespae]|uniref:lipid-A-disaccharide synthase n=1 Tax=Aristophania vespae TaxID=2697033 RepID=UPI00235121E1|nr:lipid-A-disaccharide synthase [Aristophania vespae]UMM63518.1 Lipid-A-disaccharide synthase [Aristophania vespae]
MVQRIAVQGQMQMHQRGRVVWILAGETSGDVIGARLMEAFHKRDPEIVFAGVGGGRMEALGLRSLFPMDDLAVMGFLEIVPRLRMLSQRLLEAELDIKLRRPDVVITIDSPGFSFRLLKRIAPLGIKRVHYVAPQVWAWREKRLKKYHGLWDRLLCLFPFEPEWFAKRGFEGRFVGHPVLQAGVAHGKAYRFRKRHDISDTAPVLILMPGSRSSEVPKLMPVFHQMVKLLVKEFPDLCLVIPVVPAMAPLVRHYLKKWEVQPRLVTDIQDKHDAYAAAQCAVTKSGTSTLELAMGRVPMVVTYKVNWLSAFIARHLIKVPYVAMVNLLMGTAIVPELLQKDCRADLLAETISELLRSPFKADAQKGAFSSLLQKLSPPRGETPADAAVMEILALMDGEEV